MSKRDDPRIAEAREKEKTQRLLRAYDRYYEEWFEAFIAAALTDTERGK